jgi:hypothetical protein
VFVALGIQFAMGIRSIVVYGLPISTLSHKRHHFRKKVIERNMFFYLLHNFCVIKTFLVLRSERDMITIYVGRNVKCPLFVSDFNHI